MLLQHFWTFLHLYSFLMQPRRRKAIFINQRLTMKSLSLSIVATFHIVCIGWVLFRADDMKTAGTIIYKLVMAPVELLHFSASQLAILQIRDPIIFPALLLLLPGLMISQPIITWLNDKKFYQSPPWAVQVSLMVALMCLLTIFSPDSSPRFIYFQF